MKKQKNTNFLGLFVFVTLILLAIFIFLGYIWNVVKHSDIFTVREVVVKGSATGSLSYLKGRNIFDIDSRREFRDALRSYPDYSCIKLVKIFPSRIFVEFIGRKPVALIKLYRYFAVDESGTIFYTQGSLPDEPGLPVITGLETKLFGPKPGVRYNIKELGLALEILRQAKRTHLLKYYKIRKIDVYNPDNASIFIPFADNTRRDLEVKLGSNNITDKISILAGLIINGKNDISGIKYIDLRFNEPVIKLNDVKSE
ncbi:MAG: cell division protein FtsQ/DivIB [Candidatus Omnitrophota bacterium]|jgi:cell division septal protein FtsQ